MDTYSPDDEAFVYSVGRFMNEDFKLLQENVENRIEEYLRRRVLTLTSVWKKEKEMLQAQHDEVLQQQKEIASALEIRCSQLLVNQRQCANKLCRVREENAMTRCFEKWKQWAVCRAQQKLEIEKIRNRNERFLLHQIWGRWRLSSAAKLLRKRQEVLMRSRERKLLSESTQLRNKLEETELRQKEADEQTKTAFVRGVSALNREALQVLRGTTGEDEAEAIESILRGDPTFSSAAQLYSPPFSPQLHSPYLWGQGSAEASPLSGHQKMIRDENEKETKKLSERLYKPQRNQHTAINSSMPSPISFGNTDLVLTPPKKSDNLVGDMHSMLNPGRIDPNSNGNFASERELGAAAARFGNSEGMCPVHQADTAGNFYHKCYARDSLPEGTQGRLKLSHAPFLLRVDPSVGVPLGLPAQRKRRSY